MTYEINRQDLKSTDWLLLAEDDGPDGMGRILGYVIGDSKELMSNLPRGEILDALELFLDGEIPDDFCWEVIRVDDFDESYGNRMPLRGISIRV